MRRACWSLLQHRGVFSCRRGWGLHKGQRLNHDFGSSFSFPSSGHRELSFLHLVVPQSSRRCWEEMVRLITKAVRTKIATLQSPTEFELISLLFWKSNIDDQGNSTDPPTGSCGQRRTAWQILCRKSCSSTPAELEGTGSHALDWFYKRWDPQPLPTS